MTERIKRDNTWFYHDVDSPEYTAALMKTLSSTPEISAIASRVLGDKVMAAMEQAGIEKDINLIKLGAAETRLGANKMALDTARMKLDSNVGQQYNDLVREAHKLALFKETSKDVGDPTFNNVMGALGTGLTGYSAYKKYQLADTLGKDALEKYILAAK